MLSSSSAFSSVSAFTISSSFLCSVILLLDWQHFGLLLIEMLFHEEVLTLVY